MMARALARAIDGGTATDAPTRPAVPYRHHHRDPRGPAARGQSAPFVHKRIVCWLPLSSKSGSGPPNTSELARSRQGRPTLVPRRVSST